MVVFTNCQPEDLGDGIFVCEDVHLTTGERCTAYLGPCGAYIIVDGSDAFAGRLYRAIRELLGTVHVRIYYKDYGLYDPSSDAFEPDFDDAALSSDINGWISARHMIYKPSTLSQMMARLEFEDAKARGYKLGEDGSMYLYRHGEFKPASPVSSDSNYVFALFGGTLGLHRFAMGKWFSGLLYLLTGGVFLAGWLADVLFLLLGIQKDKKKRYLFPLSDRRKKLLMLPVGLICGLVLFLIYLAVVNGLSTVFQSTMTQQIESTDPQGIQSIIDYITGLLPGFESQINP